jgi:hypothetical protein
MRGAHHAGQSGPGVNVDGGHQIQPQQSQVCQVVLCQWLAAQVGVDTAQAAKSPGGNTHAFEVGKLNATDIADHHVLDVTFAIDERPNLSAYFV